MMETIRAVAVPEGTLVKNVSMPDPWQEMQKLEGVTGADLRHTYHGDALYSHYFYQTVGVFRCLVERIVNSANTQVIFDCQTEDEAEREKHKTLARWWADNVNRDIAQQNNLAKGLSYVNASAIFNGYLEGMHLSHWRTLPVANKRVPGYPGLLVYPDFPLPGVYELPMQIITYSGVNSRLIKLQAVNGKPKLTKEGPVPGSSFNDPEFILIEVTDEYLDKAGGINNEASIYSFFNYTDPFSNVEKKVMALPWEKSMAWKFFPQYNRSRYPTLPTRSMFGILERMKALEAMDKNTIASFIRQVFIVKCGTDWHPEIVPSKIDEAGNLIEEGELDNAVKALNQVVSIGGLVAPGWWDVDKMETPDKALLDPVKIVGPLMELFNAVGIYCTYNPNDRPSPDEVAFSVQGFKDFLESFRTGGRSGGGLKAYLQHLWSTEVLASPLNQKQGITRPIQANFEPMTINVTSLLKNLFDAYMQGLVSGAYYSEALGVDAQTQKAAVVAEGHSYGQARISYRQAAQRADGSVSDVGITKNQQGGRPTEAPPKDLAIENVL